MQPKKGTGRNAAPPAPQAISVIPRVAALDLTLTRHTLRLLLELGARVGLDGWAPVRVAEIAALLSMDASTAYRGLRHLIQDGYVLRRVAMPAELRSWPRATYVYRINLLAETERGPRGVRW